MPSSLSDYQRRTLRFTEAWAAGTPIHNDVDNECTPDFSCCMPALFIADQAKRLTILQQLYERYEVIQ